MARTTRPPAEVLGEAQWLASQGVTELVLVSENSVDVYGPKVVRSTAGSMRSKGTARFLPA